MGPGHKAQDDSVGESLAVSLRLLIPDTSTSAGPLSCGATLNIRMLSHPSRATSHPQATVPNATPQGRLVGKWVRFVRLESPLPIRHGERIRVGATQGSEPAAAPRPQSFNAFAPGGHPLPLAKSKGQRGNPRVPVWGIGMILIDGYAFHARVRNFEMLTLR